MRLALISDIHGNLHALEAVLADLKRAGTIDLIWCLGDLAAFGTHPAECVAGIRSLQAEMGEKKVRVIGGNTDRYIVTGKRPETPAAHDEEGFRKRATSYAQRDALLNWGLERLSWEDYQFLSGIIGRELHTRAEGYGDIIGYHAIPGDDEPMALRPDTPDEQAADALLDRAGKLAIGGHTHLVMDRKLGSWRVINPGSVGLSLTDIRRAEWALVTIEGNQAAIDFRAVPYDTSALAESIARTGYPHPDFLTSRFPKE
jgi:predicted phosphodiesterase